MSLLWNSAEYAECTFVPFVPGEVHLIKLRVNRGHQQRVNTRMIISSICKWIRMKRSFANRREFASKNRRKQHLKILCSERNEEIYANRRKLAINHIICYSLEEEDWTFMICFLPWFTFFVISSPWFNLLVFSCIARVFGLLWSLKRKISKNTLVSMK